MCAHTEKQTNEKTIKNKAVGFISLVCFAPVSPSLCVCMCVCPKCRSFPPSSKHTFLLTRWLRLAAAVLLNVAWLFVFICHEPQGLTGPDCADVSFAPPTLGCETQRNTPHYRTLITTWKQSLKTGYYWTRPAYTWSLWFLWGNLCRYFWDDTVINGWTVLKDRSPIGPVTWLDNVPKSI